MSPISPTAVAATPALTRREKLQNAAGGALVGAVLGAYFFMPVALINPSKIPEAAVVLLMAVGGGALYGASGSPDKKAAATP